jgi:ketosteroid isomerase-like protein
MKPMLLLAFSLALTSPIASAAQDNKPAPRQGADSLAALPPEERASHEELIAFRIAVEKAFNKMGASGKMEDMIALLEFAHPDILFTAMTGESVRGKPELIEYFKRDFINEPHALTRMQTVFTADHLSILLRPDVATNRGSALGTFAFTDGKELTVNTRWTATIVKHEGRWKLAAFQFAPSIFDNPVVDAYKQWIYKAAAIAVVVGLLLGVLIGRWTRRTRVA